MELQGERLIPASVADTWTALNDSEVLKACITGCESLEREGDDKMNAVMAVKVGPVSARFKGKVQLTNVNAPTSYTLNFEGQGGAAGHGKGSADVSLEPAGAGATKLTYVARAQVGGKLAQVGSRLVDAAAAKIADGFFASFESKVAASQAPAAQVAPATHETAASYQPPNWGIVAFIAAALVAAVAYLGTR
jgi:carbon monoxide dehydrogenase subunit G